MAGNVRLTFLELEVGVFLLVLSRLHVQARLHQPHTLMSKQL